jgi:hypothetical protein
MSFSCKNEAHSISRKSNRVQACEKEESSPSSLYYEGEEAHISFKLLRKSNKNAKRETLA